MLTYGFLKGHFTASPQLVPSHHPGETQYHLHTPVSVGGTNAKWDTAINVGTDNSKDLLHKAAQASKADVYVFGRRYANNGLGIHDVHMNQGSTGQFLNNGRDDHNDHNDIWQDGAALIDFGDHWMAYFTSFLQQLVPTDQLGNPQPNAKPFVAAG